jgi:hypothetical protein
MYVVGFNILMEWLFINMLYSFTVTELSMSEKNITEEMLLEEVNRLMNPPAVPPETRVPTRDERIQSLHYSLVNRIKDMQAERKKFIGKQTAKMTSQVVRAFVEGIALSSYRGMMEWLKCNLIKGRPDMLSERPQFLLVGLGHEYDQLLGKLFLLESGMHALKCIKKKDPKAEAYSLIRNRVQRVVDGKTSWPDFVRELRGVLYRGRYNPRDIVKVES